LTALILLACSVFAASDNDGYAGLTPERVQKTTQALSDLKSSFGNVRVYQTGPVISRLYGVPFGYGTSPEATADQFRLEHAGVFGVKADDLIPGNLSKKRNLTQPVMYDAETDSYKFTLVYYRQEIDGIPLFQGELRLLVRNESGYPLVMAVSTLRDLGDFIPNKSFGGFSAVAEDIARADEPGLTDFSEQETVIWAGIESKREAPRMAVTFEGSSDFPECFRYVIDPATGEILYKENRIVFEDVVGNVSGMASEGNASADCEPESIMPFPYAKVSIGSTIAYTDENGDFTISNSGTSSVTVTSPCVGQWFNVSNYSGSEEILTTTVTPPGPANFVHNSANTSEEVLAQSNAYIQANIVRSTAITANPSYPNLTDTEFPVSVNRTDGYCPGNAWYSSSDESINFCASGSSYPNTAWNAIIHHEYGHHLVNMGGSGQGQYGEGMADGMHVVIVDNPNLALGFYGDCEEPLRTADNSFQYPCSDDIHTCAQLLTGCIWDTRNALVQTTTGPEEYLPLLRNLAVNAILLHSGTEITPQITIDWLTLDDNDGNINNGTPHYWEIAAGFGAHNMDAPELAPLSFTYPQGVPTLLSPGVQTSFTVVVSGIEGNTPVSGTGQLYYNVDGSTYTSVYMTETTANNYIATLPPADCLQRVNFYLSAEADGIGEVYDPSPVDPYSAFVATDEEVIFSDNFDTDQGWTISGGSWERGTPTGDGGEYGNPDPSSGHSGSNVYGYNLDGDYENSMPERHLTSPAIDCSELANVTFSFWRWLGVEQPLYDHAYIRISNDGSSWTTIWENDVTISDNSWTEYTYDISSYADGEATVYIRFTMGTTDGSWRYCGWNIDDVEVKGYTCNVNAPNITTTLIPDWTAWYPLSQTLAAEGGTTPYVWADKNSDLSGTGLSLSTAGVLSGTPTNAGWLSFVAQVTDDSLYTDEKQFTFQINEALQITTTTLPNWTDGGSYSQQLAGTGGTGSPEWSDKNGDLVGTGLTLSRGGLLSGTVSEGTISFTALYTDDIGATAEQALSFTVNPVLQITTTSLPDGDLNEPYSQTLTTTGGTGTKTWTDLNDDLDGTGLSLSYNGVLSGTPITPGTISFTAHVADMGGGSDDETFSFEIIQALQILTEEVPDWTEGFAMNLQLEGIGGVGSRTWIDKNDDLAGTGLTLSTSGLLNGTPTTTGTISFTAALSDEAKTTVEQTYSFILNPALTITTESLPNGELGELYVANISSTGGTGGRITSDKNGVLAGFGLSIVAIGQIQGTPSTAGTVDLVVLVTDAIGATVEKSLPFEITQPLTIITETLPEWTINVAYSYQLEATGGTGDETWIDKNGDLTGTGLALGTDGLLNGTPTTAGTIEFTAMVSNERGSDEKALNLTINPAPALSSSLPDWTVGVPYSQQLSGTGGTGDISYTDLYGTLGSYGLSLSTTGLVSGTPTTAGTAEFTCHLTDEVGATGDFPMTFLLNEEVTVVTTSLPYGSAETAYSQQLAATGGTGSLTWSDANSGLAGTGLSLSASGLLSGTPTEEQTISFMAQAADEVGGIGQQTLTIEIGPAWICGDINGSGAGPDIEDLVYLVDYMFNGGPAPIFMEAVDVNGDGSIADIADLVYLVDYMFNSGPSLNCP